MGRWQTDFEIRGMLPSVMRSVAVYVLGLTVILSLCFPHLPEN